MLPKSVLDRFVEKCPAAVMIRATLENLLRPERLDQIFADDAERHVAGDPGEPPRQERRVAVLAQAWRPYVECCIEAFGATRCMFASNFPVDQLSCDYTVLWNAFKRIASGCSPTERAALFAGTAERVYRLDLSR